VKITAYNDTSVFEELKSEWNELVHRSHADTVFSTVEWQRNWWNAYEPGELWVVTARDGDNRLIGIGSWFIETKSDGERVVRGIGCVDVTDYVDCIVDRDCTDQVFGCLAEHLKQNSDRYDRINFCNLPHYSPTPTQFPTFLERLGFDVEIEQQEVCPVIELPDDWEGYLNLLDKKNRHELRRKMRRSGADGEIDWYIVNESHNLEEQLALFLRLMAESAKYKAEFLQNPQHVAFFNSVMPEMYANGWLQLVFLTIDGEHAAAYLNFDYNKHILVYNSGLSRDFVNASPGILLLAHNIRYAIENGYEVFDFLRGNEEYKYRMGGKDTAVYMLKARRVESATS
jgi:CelD/BcsL family acetyltransferase involved in cellulose biosynthesis